MKNGLYSPISKKNDMNAFESSSLKLKPYFGHVVCKGTLVFTIANMLFNYMTRYFFPNHECT
jgi:hypothetical protein